MKKISKIFFSLVSVFALFGCGLFAQNLLLDTKIIESVNHGETRDIPASQILPSNVKYICNLPPYFHLDFLSDEASRRMLGQLDLPSVDEEAYFVYLDRNEKLIKNDHLFLYSEKFRWNSSDENFTDRCLNIMDASIRVTAHNDYYDIRLKQN